MKILRLCTAVLLSVLAASCSPEEDKTTKTTNDVKKPQVIVLYSTILPVAHIAGIIGGEKVLSKSLIPEGQTPHSFAATLSDIKSVHGAKMFFSISLPLEQQKVNKIFSSGGVINVDVSEGVKRIPIVAHHHHDHEDHAHKEDSDEHAEQYDPHIWLSPPNCVIIARNICKALSEQDSANTAYYQENLKKYEARANKINTQSAKLLAPCKGRSFFVYHPAFGYFAHRYAMKQRAIEFSGRPPSAKELKELISDARKENAQLILVQPQYSEKSAQFAASAIGAEVMRVDPLAPDSLKTIETLAAAIAAAAAK